MEFVLATEPIQPPHQQSQPGSKQHSPFRNSTEVHHKGILEIIEDGLPNPFLPGANKNGAVRGTFAITTLDRLPLTFLHLRLLASKKESVTDLQYCKGDNVQKVLPQCLAQKRAVKQMVPITNNLLVILQLPSSLRGGGSGEP